MFRKAELPAPPNSYNESGDCTMIEPCSYEAPTACSPAVKGVETEKVEAPCFLPFASQNNPGGGAIIALSPDGKRRLRKKP